MENSDLRERRTIEFLDVLRGRLRVIMRDAEEFGMATPARLVADLAREVSEGTRYKHMNKRGRY